MLTQAHFVVVGATTLVVVVAVLLHYETSIYLSRKLEHTGLTQRGRILMLVFSLLVLHIVEIWLFGLLAWGLVNVGDAGTLVAPYSLGFLDFIYMSAVTYSTLGFGDIVPEGPVRFLYGTEGLVGFALITWSASLTFLEMQRHWRD